jgi:hypothetical protein
VRRASILPAIVPHIPLPTPNPLPSVRADQTRLIHNHPHQHNYETEVVSALCMVRSFETETVFVMCNAGGDEIEGFMGGSGVWAPLRGCVAKMGAAEGVQVVEVDPSVLKVGPAGRCGAVIADLMLIGRRTAGRRTRSERTGVAGRHREGVVMYVEMHLFPHRACLLHRGAPGRREWCERLYSTRSWASHQSHKNRLRA